MTVQSMRSLITLVVLLSLCVVDGAGFAQAAPPPALRSISALPDCRTAWRTLTPSGAHRFDPKRDKTYSAYSTKLSRSRCIKEWNILVYMAADNDLHPYALWDLSEMEAAFASSPEAVGSSISTDTLVQLDGYGDSGVDRLHIFQSDQPFKARKLEDFQGAGAYKVRSPLVSRLPESIGANPSKALTDFVLWASKNYPSKRTLLIVWGHGQGWTSLKPKVPAESRFLDSSDLPPALGGNAWDAPPPPGRWGGVAFDETDQSALNIPSLQASLAQIQKALGKQIDVYASDSCLMQMAEVATEIAPHARFVVGSTQIQSFQGLPYRRLLYEINHGSFGGERAAVGGAGTAAGSDEPYLVARMLPKLMRASMNPASGSQGRADPKGIQTLLIGSLNSRELDGVLIPSLGGLARALLEYQREEPLRVMDLRFAVQSTPTFEGNAQDLGIFLGILSELLRQEQEITRLPPSRAALNLKAAIAEASQALNLSVTAYAYGRKYGVDGLGVFDGYLPRALSVWLPQSPEDYQKRARDFSRSRFYKTLPAWGQWLRALWS